MRGNIQVKLSRRQAVDILNLIEDELEDGDPEAEDRGSLMRAAGIIEEAIKRLDDRLERMR